MFGGKFEGREVGDLMDHVVAFTEGKAARRSWTEAKYAIISRFDYECVSKGTTRQNGALHFFFSVLSSVDLQ